MPRIADYTVIRDAQFTISNPGDPDDDFNFTLSPGAHLASQSVLSYQFAVNGAQNLTLQVRVNNVSQQSGTISGTHVGTLQEVIDVNVLNAGQNNIEFQIINGTGDLRLSDVVLQYQRDI